MPKIIFTPFTSPEYAYRCVRGCRRGRQNQLIDPNDPHWKGTISGATLEYHAHTECKEVWQSEVDRNWDLELNRELQSCNRRLYFSSDWFDEKYPANGSTVNLCVIQRYKTFITQAWPWLIGRQDDNIFQKYYRDIKRAIEIIRSFRGIDISVSTNKYCLQVPQGWLFRDLEHIYDYGPSAINGTCRGGKLVSVTSSNLDVAHFYIAVAIDAVPAEDREIWPAEQQAGIARAYVPIEPICVDILGCKGISRQRF